MLAGSFAAVLTFSVADLSSRAQEAVGGLLSVFAVGLVTWMIFWMRRTAAGLAAHLRGEVRRAALVGAGALTLTAFLAVGREGLETTLFLWTAARASGQTAAPLAGAAIGIAAAVALCWLLYRRAVRMNVGVFFNRTAIVLIVIAAGVLAYGLGDLQDAGLLPGRAWVAFDLTPHIDPGSWWASIITGITELSPKMTVLQVTAWLAYLAVVIPLFVMRFVPEAPKAPASDPGRLRGGRWERLAGRRPWAVAGVLVAVPALAAGATIAALPAAATTAGMAMTVTKTDCAPEWTSGTTGTHTFTVTNNSGLAGEINLDNAAGAVVGEIETIGPGTSAALTATLGTGTYHLHVPDGLPGGDGLAAGPGHRRDREHPGPGRRQAGHRPGPDPGERPLPGLRRRPARGPGGQVATIQSDLRRDDIAKAKQDWLAAQLDWERVGASYDSFGDLGLAVDGLPDGYPSGVNDKGFTGLHRLEYGLWHGQRAASSSRSPPRWPRTSPPCGRTWHLTTWPAIPPTCRSARTRSSRTRSATTCPALTTRAAGAAFAQTYADVQVTRAILGYLAPLIDARQPGLVASLTAELDTLDQALLADPRRLRRTARGPSLGAAPLSAREHVDAAIGAELESAASVPDLLEVPPAH